MKSFYEKPILQIPQCICPISRNAPHWNGNVPTSVPKWCIIGYGIGALWDLWDWFITRVPEVGAGIIPCMHPAHWLGTCTEWSMELAWRIRTKLHVFHDDVIKWKHFPHYWPFVRGIMCWEKNGIITSKQKKTMCVMGHFLPMPNKLLFINTFLGMSVILRMHEINVIEIIYTLRMSTKVWIPLTYHQNPQPQLNVGHFTRRTCHAPSDVVDRTTHKSSEQQRLHSCRISYAMVKSKLC